MRVQKTYFMLTTADTARAARFYQRALGCEPTFESPDWSELRSGGAVVALHGHGAVADRDTGLGFEVDDLEAACAAVVDAGGTVVMPPSDRPGEPIRLAVARDTEGNAFSLAQYKRE